MSNSNTGISNALSISWHDSSWIPILNPSNIMDYFSQSNIFYDRSCNNEIVKMQRVNPEQMTNMTGLEYILLHVQEPILYVIRKQYRHSPSQATPQTDFYIIAGVVYQAPDLCSVLNSRLLNTVTALQTAFEEARSFSQYHPSKGYYWDFKGKDKTEKAAGEDKKKQKEEPSSLFQRQRVDILLAELAKKFPPKYQAGVPPEKPAEEVVKVEKPEAVVKQEVKTEKPDDRASSVTSQVNSSVKPPPEKKPKVTR